MIVAQAAGSIFQVGFEVKNGIALFAMALAGELGDIAEQGRALVGDQVGQSLVMQAREKPGIAGDQPCVQHADVELGVVAVEFFAFGERARVGTGAQPQIPEHAGDRLDALMITGLDAMVLAEEQQIDVRVGEEGAAAVSAQRHHADLFQAAGFGREEVAGQIDKDSIHQRGALLDGAAAIGAVLGGRAHFRFLADSSV